MTVVLQSGEDLSYSDDDISDIVSEIKRRWPTCAVTLSIGEKTRESYQKYYDAGATDISSDMKHQIPALCLPASFMDVSQEPPKMP